VVIRCEFETLVTDILVIDRIPYFMYVQSIHLTGKGKTMALIRSMNVEPEIVNTTKCDMNYACLSGKAVCVVEPFVDREVLLLRCRDERTCAYKKKYQGRLICSCPVNIASYNPN
jgi:hypothetical protein